MVVSDTVPMCSLSWDRGPVVTLSTMMLLDCVNPAMSSGVNGIRNSGSSVGSLVIGQMVTEFVASNRSA